MSRFSPLQARETDLAGILLLYPNMPPAGNGFLRQWARSFPPPRIDSAPAAVYHGTQITSRAAGTGYALPLRALLSIKNTSRRAWDRSWQ